MTICIAALCDDGQSCVVAADRMAVFGGGSLLEFKLDDNATKIYRINDTVLLLHSGRKQDAETIITKLPSDQGKDVPREIDKIVTDELHNRRDQLASRLLGTNITYEKLTDKIASTGGAFKRYLATGSKGRLRGNARSVT